MRTKMSQPSLLMLTAVLCLMSPLTMGNVFRFSSEDPVDIDMGELRWEELKAFNEFRHLFHSVLGDEEPDAEPYTGNSSKLMSFSFENCGDASKEIVVPKSFSLSPDPIRLPGEVTASGSFQVKQTVGSPIKTKLKVQKKVAFIWITVPCIHGMGSCTYDDMCSKIPRKSCPPIFQKLHLNCHCPFNAGSFALPPTTFRVNKKAPFNGAYRIRAEMSYKGKPLTCVQMSFTLK